MKLIRKFVKNLSVFLCLHLVLAEWPRDFPNRAQKERNKNHVPREHEPFPDFDVAWSTSLGKTDGMAQATTNEEDEVDQLAKENLEDKSSFSTGANIHESDRSKPRLAPSLSTTSHLTSSSTFPVNHHNDSMHLDLSPDWARFRVLWNKVASLTEKFESSSNNFLHSELLKSMIWPTVMSVLGLGVLFTIGCLCCCIRRPIYCCGRQLCDYSHDSATNYRQAMQLKNEAERGKHTIEMTNIPHEDVTKATVHKPTASTGAIPKSNRSPSPVPSTTSLVPI